MQILFRRKTVPDELNERQDDGIHAWVAENGNTTDETMADLVETILLPHILKHGGGPRGRRTLFIVDGAGSHKGPLFKATCKRNNIDLAVIPASCTDEIQLIDVAVNGEFKNQMYYEWAMWMMSGVQKIQPKSGNRVAANFLDILRWCEKARLSVKRETILANVEKCYMTSEPGEKFDVEPKPESMQIEEAAKSNKKKVVVVKSKTPEQMAKLELKKERKKKRLEREKRKQQKEKVPKRKATPKKKPRKKSPIRRVVRRKSMRKKKKKN